jgi:hypothetical protein
MMASLRLQSGLAKSFTLTLPPLPAVVPVQPLQGYHHSHLITTMAEKQSITHIESEAIKEGLVIAVDKGHAAGNVLLIVSDGIIHKLPYSDL